MANQRLDIFQVEVFSTPGVSRDPALNSPHLASPLILLGNFTYCSLSLFQAVPSGPTTFLKPQWLFQTCSCLKALTLVKFSLQITPSSQHPCASLSPASVAQLKITSPKRPTGNSVSHVPPPCHPLVYSLAGVYHDLRVFLIGLANSTEHSLK